MIIQQKSYKLTSETILERISQYDIYRHYIGRNFTLGTAINSPLRKENNPSFVINQKNGQYYHLDYAHSDFRGDCFDLVKQMFGLSFDQALSKIEQDFGLASSSSGNIRSVLKPVYTQPKQEKSYRTIQVEPKSFTPGELKYWGDYYQGLPELKAENVYSVGKLFLDKQRFTLGGNEMVFGYLYEDKYWKIYRPLIKGKGKWISTVPLQLVDGLEDIKNCRNAAVLGSKKDKMVMKHLLPSASVQNESIAAFSDDTVCWLNGEVRGFVYIGFDSDGPGKEASLRVTKEFGYKHVNIPDIYLQEGIKDFADLAKVHGLNSVQEYLKSKEII